MNGARNAGFTLGGGAIVLWVLLVLSAIPAYVTHLIWVLSNLNADNAVTIIVFGLFAAIVAFVGVVHGWSIWFGAEWLTPVYTKTMVFITELIGLGA